MASGPWRGSKTKLLVPVGRRFSSQTGGCAPWSDKGYLRRATFSIAGDGYRRSTDTAGVAGKSARVAQLFTVAHTS